ncbi:hypothetical protein RJ639_013633 [Escallonia herrerae]|uniref:Large ribosomal subunit protein uL15/eL18 domain-containing protein n=1 Tax=Escallonia herrerae TaxID=1293975 RepID=A0AA89AQV6_9ASTE|nr:hypothetical protein RJ639_013633 [Escallonia herrerae]
MASILSLSATTPARTALRIHHTSSPFKGNVQNLKPNPCHKIPSFKLHRHHKTKTATPTSLVILNQASPSPIPTAAATSSVRFRLDNLGPQPGSRKKAKRKGRGHAAGQGGSCGFGMRGQKSRSGPGVRKGFEGGQMPLYRRLPKLRGIAGGPFEVDVPYVKCGHNFDLDMIECAFVGSFKISVRDGELSVKLNFKARAFSEQAKAKLEAAGCSLTTLPGRKKWVKPAVTKNLARAEAYFAKKRASPEWTEPSSA